MWPQGRVSTPTAVWCGSVATKPRPGKPLEHPHQHHSQGVPSRGTVATVLVLMQVPEAHSHSPKMCDHQVEAEACESARTLLALGVDVNNCTEYGTTALDQAASRALPRLCQLLLDAGAHVEPDSTRETPLICALDAHCLETASLLLAAGATVDKETAGGLTALSMSCIEGNIEAVRFLLEQGADPNHVGANFSTPAILAAINNNAAALQLLVEAGADLQYENELNITPLVRSVGL